VRALLVSNPSATTTSPAVTDVIARALSTEMKLDVETTKRRHHAGFLAAGAVHEGYELVIALGGDGTVNEVLQGVADSDVKLGILPGGSTNVWARTLGLPRDPVEAAAALLRRVRDGEERTINLGVANGRYFAFSAGFGFDAHVVRAVEERERLKRALGQGAFVWCGLTAAATYDRRAADIRVVVGGATVGSGFRAVVCCNSNPWTYLGPFAVELCPQADLEAGLDAAGLTRIGVGTVLRLARATISGRVRKLRDVCLWHDQDAFELVNPTPLALELDGDYVGETERVRVRTARSALTVLA
jgi:diacylglycerol kinase family enzyme